MRVFVMCLFSTAYAFCQTPPSFDVAEIKVNRSGAIASQGDISNGRLMVNNIPLRYLIAEAWSLRADGVVGPGWLDEVRVDIVAKAASPFVPDATIREMVQTLLKERMKLAAHVENRVEPVYALSVWKGSHKLTRSELPAKPEDADCSLRVADERARLECRHMSMAAFAHELPGWANRYVDKRIVDDTQLSGAWEFKLEWTPFAQLESEGGLTLFAAIESQLGLHLESKRLPVPMVVVDSMEKAPPEN